MPGGSYSRGVSEVRPPEGQFEPPPSKRQLLLVAVAVVAVTLLLAALAISVVIF